MSQEWLVSDFAKGAGFVSLGVFLGKGVTDKGYQHIRIGKTRVNGTTWEQKPQFDPEIRSTGEPTPIVRQLADLKVGSPIAVIVEDVNAGRSDRGSWFKAVAVYELAVVDVEPASSELVGSNGKGR